ncbi:RNA-binding S4 domain-containing protein [Massilia cavernae]|uniref:RNA-binding S4 domain-containing protein n=1 Tax=Massilia cavernae TaxID=2320864 RepID=A0A418X7L5_9BURK|nr:RNA-binding S4 domain-containing protein [Massilia cavernae]RJG08431.1 RNA-binding S4 domain-containing protein [Massilia cavernae]
MDNVRIDKWLWAARFFKTRSLATDAVDTGRVKLGGDRIKPARVVRVGDKLTIDNGSDAWEVIVVDISDKRGGAPVARGLYDETEASIVKRENDAQARKIYREPASTIKGRPTKRDRRQLGRASE